MSDFLKEIIEIAKGAGKEIMNLYHKDVSVSEKKDKTVVTEADFKSNEYILESLEKYGFPVLSEEKKDDNSRLKSEKVWIVDPLDGTNDFLEETGDFSVMIGLTESQRPILGVVYHPFFDVVYCAEKNKGAFKIEKNKEPEKISVSSINELSEIRMIASRSHFAEDNRKLKDYLRIENIKRVGGNGVKIGLITEGKADLFFNSTNRMGEWDSCAPDIILKEAGGEMTGVDGKELLYNKENPLNEFGILASNGLIHDEIIKALKSIND